jgi:hypothetical protein
MTATSLFGVFLRAPAREEMLTNSIRHATDSHLSARVRARMVMILIPRTELGVGSRDLHPHNKVRNRI